MSSAGQAKSPVAGGEWDRKLSKDYKKKKVSDGLPGIANMEESGDMLDSLTFDTTDRGIEVGWFGAEAGKADGHNNFSGKSSLPRRQTLPDVGEEFVSKIQTEMEKIVADALADELQFKEEDFSAVNTKGELYDVLSEYFPDLTRTEVKGVISRAPDLADLLDSLNLLQLL